jgi:hypothetical protein
MSRRRSSAGCARQPGWQQGRGFNVPGIRGYQVAGHSSIDCKIAKPVLRRTIGERPGRCWSLSYRHCGLASNRSTISKNRNAKSKQFAVDMKDVIGRIRSKNYRRYPLTVSAL